MDDLNDPCGEQDGTAGPVWNALPAVYGDVKHLRNYRFNDAHIEMCYAPRSPLNHPMLIIRSGNSEHRPDLEFVAINLNPHEELKDYRGTPEMKQLFEIAYACAEQKGYIA